MKQVDAIAIGSGIGGLVAGAMLARYGWRVVVCESHGKPGGAAHGFERAGFRFDTGPSFFCGLGDPTSINPLRQVLTVLGEGLETITYDPLGIYHLPEGDLPIFCKLDRYREAIARFTPQGAKEFAAFEQRMLALYEGLRQIPTLSLRPDGRGLGEVLWRYPWALLRLLPQLPTIQGSVGDMLDVTVRDPWVRRLVDLECFLLSGLTAAETVAPEVSFMLGERAHSVVDYPLGGGEAIIQALVRGLEKWGGELRLNAHVDQIWVEEGKVRGVKLRRGEVIEAPVVISNATLWDTVTHLLEPGVVPPSLSQLASQTAAIDSFMHLHLGIRAEGLDDMCGHHVVLHDGDADLTKPGNTCMISMPSVWDASLAPPGHHVLHAYTLEPFEDWQRDQTYKDKKQLRAATLYRAVERVIPDVHDRIVVERIGTPLTHARYLRRHRGTYGPAIAAHQGQFPPPQTPISGLYRVGDSSTLPGIGVPAVAASGILCANALVSPAQTAELLPLIGK